jgi:hypothetical protein
MAKKSTEETTNPGPLPGFGKMVKPPKGFGGDDLDKPAPKKRSTKTGPTTTETDPPKGSGDGTWNDTGDGTALDGGGRADLPPIAPAKRGRKPRTPKTTVPRTTTSPSETGDAMAPVLTAVGKLKDKIARRDEKYAALEQKIADLKVAHETAIAEARAAGFDAGYKKGIKDAADHLKELS